MIQSEVYLVYSLPGSHSVHDVDRTCDNMHQDWLDKVHRYLGDIHPHYWQRVLQSFEETNLRDNTQVVANHKSCNTTYDL